jgi:hypothetical protein
MPEGIWGSPGFKTDGLAIAALCSNLVLFWQADRAVQELGSVREELNATGVSTLRMNPSVRVRSDAEKKLRACLATLWP